MKLCVIGLRGIPNVMGGIETHCQNLYPFLSSRLDITVLARSPYVEEKGVYKGVKVKPVWAVKNKYLETMLHTFLAVFYAKFVVKCDVVHIHAIGPALMSPLARLLGMQVIVTHHGADYDRAKWNAFAKFLLRCGEWLSVKCSNHMIVVGKILTDRLKSTYPEQADKIHFIPNGATLPEVDSCSPDTLSEIDERIEKGNYFLYVGRLVPEKGVHDLINAYRNVESDKLLVIVGDADHQDDYSLMLKSNASDTIIFTGRRGGSQLAALYRYAHCFILPSYHEGLPIVALEAISAKVPVLLSSIEPNLGIGLSSEHYFPVGEADVLANKLQNAIPKLVPVEFLEDFQWENVAEDTLQIYGSVIDYDQVAHVPTKPIKPI